MTRSLVPTGLALVALISPMTQAATPQHILVTTVHEFHHDPNDPQGARPGTIVVAPDGTLYGTTAEGGPYGAGILCAIKPTGDLQTLYTCKGPDGFHPDHCLLAGADGAFYGTTGFESYQERKTAFRITPDGTMLQLETFHPPRTREEFRSLLVRGSDGHLYAVNNAADHSFVLVSHKS